MSSGSKWGYVEAIVGSLSGYSGGTLGIVVEVIRQVKKSWPLSKRYSGGKVSALPGKVTQEFSFVACTCFFKMT